VDRGSGNQTGDDDAGRARLAMTTLQARRARQFVTDDNDVRSFSARSHQCRPIATLACRFHAEVTPGVC